MPELRPGCSAFKAKADLAVGSHGACLDYAATVWMNFVIEPPSIFSEASVFQGALTYVSWRLKVSFQCPTLNGRMEVDGADRSSLQCLEFQWHMYIHIQRHRDSDHSPCSALVLWYDLIHLRSELCGQQDVAHLEAPLSTEGKLGMFTHTHTHTLFSNRWKDLYIFLLGHLGSRASVRNLSARTLHRPPTMGAKCTAVEGRICLKEDFPCAQSRSKIQWINKRIWCGSDLLHLFWHFCWFGKWM